MHRFTGFLLLAFVVTATASAHSNNCADRRAVHALLAKGTIASPLENDYDIQNLVLDIAMTNLSTSISGFATTTATVINASGMSQYAFELDTALTIDSCKINGTLYPVAASGGFLRIVSPGNALSAGAVFTAQVWYHGAPPAGTGFFTHGVIHNTLSTGTQITYTVSDPYLAKDWWPCKQSLTDKINKVSMKITVPAGLKAGSNGLLQQVVPAGSSNRYEWSTNYPIEYYLICASVAPYSEYSSWMHFSGSTDSMLVQHFLYDTATVRPLFQSALDSTGILIDYFSQRYGRYPFWQEKYGHCFSPLGGGMEHQTMTTIGVYDMPLVAHELGHQWWGDAVTYNAWKDIWLSEGWATYTEQLFVERFRGAAAAKSYRSVQYNHVLSQPGGTVIVDDTTNVYRIFDGRLTYYKGAAVANMLRYVFANDVAFFGGLQAYQQQYQFRTASTPDFKAVMETAFTHPLDTFFNQWVYGEGYPVFDAVWNQTGNTVDIQLTQTTSAPLSVPLFHTPLEIRLQGATRDTVVKIYAADSVQMFSFTFSDPMTDIVIDPDNQILNKVGSVIQDPSLAVKDAAVGGIAIASPNPAKDTWLLRGLKPGAIMNLYDVAGKKVWQGAAVAESLKVPCAHLAPGIYQLEIKRNAGAKAQMLQLQKI